MENLDAIEEIFALKGRIISGRINADGADAPKKAICEAIENHELGKAKGVVIHFAVNPETPVINTLEAAIFLSERLNDEARIEYYTHSDESVKTSETTLTFVAVI